MSDPDAAQRPEVTYRIDDGVAHIQLNRPRALNAWTPLTGRQLLAAVRAASADSAVRCALITGAGRSFCAGADVKNPRELLPDGTPDLAVRLRTIYNPIVTQIRSAPIPYIAAVQGACAGLGVSLALACDVVVAAEDAFFALVFVKLALTPDAGSTAFLRERVGVLRSAELAMLAERLPARAALDWGLVRSLHPVGELHSVAAGLAAQLAVRDQAVLARAKTALGGYRLDYLRRQLNLEADIQQCNGPTADYAEGVAAFREKRAPEFLGR